MEINGQRVLVTGGQRGVGAALTAEMLTRGAERVYVTAREPKPSTDPRVIPIPLEVTRQRSVDELAQAAPDVSIVVNNAGTIGALPVLGTDVEGMRAVFDTNVFGPVRIAQAFAPILAGHPQSALVNVHSVMSWLAGTGSYGASKAALWSVTNSLRLELAAQGTTVTGVHLGFVDTEMTTRLSVPKHSPALVASRVADGIERGEREVLVDEESRTTKAALAGPVEALVAVFA